MSRSTIAGVVIIIGLVVFFTIKIIGRGTRTQHMGTRGAKGVTGDPDFGEEDQSK